MNNPLLPPTLDPVAVARWQRVAPLESPWLHEEVARRMLERLQWIRLQPASWVHWDALRGGQQAQAQLLRHYPDSICFIVETQQTHVQTAVKSGEKIPLWRQPVQWLQMRQAAAKVQHARPPTGGVDMLWANMALHVAPAPQALIGQWHQTLATGGFLMFSCLGPDTLRALRSLYAAAGWQPPAHELTDMHDWGDMLVQAGFAEPVMDMERITLTFDSPERLLQELAGLGRNFHKARFSGLRGRAWKTALLQTLSRELVSPDGRLALEFEIIYGHALKAAPRVRVHPVSLVSEVEMRQLLQRKKPLG